MDSLKTSIFSTRSEIVGHHNRSQILDWPKPLPDLSPVQAVSDYIDNVIE
jgi:hypothetical protein